MIASEPILKSVKEEADPQLSYSININYEWLLPVDAEHQQERTFFVGASKMRDKSCSTRLFSSPRSPSYEERRKWYFTPRLSRVEFVAILTKSEQDLRQRHDGCYIGYLHVQYQTVVEHEAELTPLIGQIFAEETGEFNAGNRTVKKKLEKLFKSSKAIAITRQSLKRQGLEFSLSFLDEFWPVVDRKLAMSWKAASELSGNGLCNPPSIVLYRKPSEPAGAGKPANKPADKPPVKVQPSTPTSKAAPRYPTG